MGSAHSGVKGSDVLGQAVETETVFFHEIVVKEVFRDDRVDHGQSQGAITAGTKLEPVVGSLRRADAPRVHDDHLLGLLEALLNMLPHMPSAAPVSAWLQPQFMMQAGVVPPKP